jgi:hypothetical protein
MRAIALMLGVLALTLQQIAPPCLKPASVAHQLTIVMCTAAGLQRVVIDDNGSPVDHEQQDHGSTCTLCTHHPNKFTSGPSETNTVQAAPAGVLPRPIHHVRSSLLIFEFYASRAPPHLPG